MFRASGLYSKYLRSLNLQIAAIAILATGTGISAEHRPTPRPDAVKVGSNVLVSGALPAWSHYEYVADADPLDPTHLIACSIQFSPKYNWQTVADYVSSDGGNHWELSDQHQFLQSGWDNPKSDSSVPYVQGGIDPFCWYGLDHDAFDNSDGYPVRRSTDGGHMWNALAMVGGDNEYFAFDRTNSPYRGRLYHYGTAEPPSSLGFGYSTDGGQTFKTPELTPVQNADSIAKAGIGTVSPDGALLIPILIHRDNGAKYLEPGYYSLAVFATRDGGEHFEQPVPLDQRHLQTPYTVCPNRRDGKYASMTTDLSDGPYKGRIYLTWSSMVHGHCAVLLSYSDDDGRSWSSFSRASDEPDSFGKAKREGPDSTLPEVAVNSKGVVGLTWYDRREDSRNKNHRLRFRASLDGGVTWLSSVAVSTSAYVVDNVPKYVPMGIDSFSSRDQYVWDIMPAGPQEVYEGSMDGDYAGIAATVDGRFHAFWIDNRTGIGQLYTSTIEVSGTPTRNGATELADLAPLDSFVARVRIRSSEWNPKTGEASFVYDLANYSADRIVAPLKVRITDVSSDLGPSTLLSNGVTTEVGQIFDISSSLPPEGLAPCEVSEPRELRIHIDFQHPLSETAHRDIAQIKAHIYAGKPIQRASKPCRELKVTKNERSS